MKEVLNKLLSHSRKKPDTLFFYTNLILSIKIKLFYSLGLLNYLLKLSDVRKVLETLLFLALGSFGTLGPKLSHGTSWIAEIIHWIISPNVRTHLRKVLKKTLYSI